MEGNKKNQESKRISEPRPMRKNLDSFASLPNLFKQALKDLALLVPSDLVPPLHHDARHGLDANDVPRGLGHGIDPPRGVLVLEPQSHHGLGHARRDADADEPGLVADVAAVLEVALEEGLDDARLGGWAELVQGEGDEAVGGAGAAREAADGEGDVVLCAGDLDAGEEVWVEVVEAVVDGALLDVVWPGVSNMTIGGVVRTSCEGQDD